MRVLQFRDARLERCRLRRRLGEKVGLVLLQPLEIGGTVARLEAQVRDDDMMQCRDRLAEREMARDLAGEEGRLAQRVRCKGERRRGGV